MKKLNDDEVFVHIGRSSRSLLLEVIADDESIELTYAALIKFFQDLGLTWGEVEE